MTLIFDAYDPDRVEAIEIEYLTQAPSVIVYKQCVYRHVGETIGDIQALYVAVPALFIKDKL